MPFPPAITSRTYTGTLLGLNAEPANGTLTFTLSHPLYDTADNLIVGPDRPITATVTNGLFTADLPVAPWHYRVRIDTDVLTDVYPLVVTTGTGPLRFADTYRTAAPPTNLQHLAALGHHHATTDIPGLEQRLEQLEAGSGGSGGGTTDHGALTGLGDDDHTHYLTTSRGDARYVQSAALDDLVTTEQLGTRASVSHQHPISDVTNLQAVLDAKQAAGEYVNLPTLAAGLSGRGLQDAGVRQFAAQFGPAGEVGPWAVCPVEWRSDPVAADVGHVLDWRMSTMAVLTNPGGTNGEFDLAAIDHTTPGAPVILRCLSSGTAAPAPNGLAGMYQPGGTLRPWNHTEAWTVTGADLVDGTVTLALLYRPGDAGVTVGHPTLPSRVTVLNHGSTAPDTPELALLAGTVPPAGTVLYVGNVIDGYVPVTEAYYDTGTGDIGSMNPGG